MLLEEQRKKTEQQKKKKKEKKQEANGTNLISKQKKKKWIRLQSEQSYYLNKDEENEACLKIVIEKLEGELKEQQERFTEARKPDYNALTKMNGLMKKKMGKIGENLVKNLLNEFQDSKGEM